MGALAIFLCVATVPLLVTSSLAPEGVGAVLKLMCVEIGPSLIPSNVALKN